MRKERTKPQSEWMAKKCPYFDGIDQYGRPMTECSYPWSNRCDGERHKCYKLKLRWLASLPENKRKVEQEKYSS